MIEARGIWKSYGALDVLKGLDVDVPRARITAIIGPNASGKTTFNKILLGLVHPDDGVIRIDGAVVNDSSAYRKGIGYMPQAARFPDNLCADDVFRMISDLRGEAGARDEELIEAFSLGSVLRTPIRVLSGGMRQRVSASLAFLFRPTLLLLDEPTAGLDPISSSTLKDKILRARDVGATVIVTSHVLSEVEELADQVIFLLDGVARFTGTPEEFKARTRQATLERAVASLMRDPAALVVTEEASCP